MTPIEEHFVCHRNDIPDADAETWQVRVTGVDGESTLSMDTVRETFPTVAVGHTMECAGNNRGQYDSKTGSIQWGSGAVATAIWTGASVRTVLKDCGLDVHDDSDHWLTVVGGDLPADDRVYVKSIPLSKALEGCLLAYEMNGRSLPAEHGFPIRLIVPGWYGTNSVKWVEEIRVTDTMVNTATFADEGEGRTYTYWQHGAYRIHPSGSEPTVKKTVPTTNTWDQLVGDDVDYPYTFDENVMSLISYPDGESPVRPDENGCAEVRGVDPDHRLHTSSHQRNSGVQIHP